MATSPLGFGELSLFLLTTASPAYRQVFWVHRLTCSRHAQISVIPSSHGESSAGAGASEPWQRFAIRGRVPDGVGSPECTRRSLSETSGIRPCGLGP
jgi:hypothetical protein